MLFIRSTNMINYFYNFPIYMSVSKNMIKIDMTSKLFIDMLSMYCWNFMIRTAYMYTFWVNKYQYDQILICCSKE